MHEFDSAAKALAESVLAQLRDLAALDPAPLNGTIAPSALADLVRPMINAHGNDPDDVLDFFTSTLAPAVIRADSPRFLAWIPSAPTKASMLFDAIVSLASISGVSWIESAGAVWAENEALRFIADLAGMPARAGGTFVQGGSAANLSALAVARESGRRRLGDPRRRLQFRGHRRHAFVGAQHDAVARRRPAPRATGPRPFHRRSARGDPRVVCGSGLGVCSGRQRREHQRGPRRRPRRDRADLRRARAVDARRRRVRRRRLLVAPSARAAFAGIERSDSLVVDPHKWLYAPLDCAALLYRDPELAKSVHGQHASYLDTVNDNTEGWNPGDYAYQLSRRARGLPFWFSVAVHGTDAYRDAVEQVLATTRAATARIKALPHLELVLEPELSVVLFRRLGWDTAQYTAWSDRLLHEQIGLVVPTRWHGETVARFAFLHPDTTLDIVDEILATTA